MEEEINRNNLTKSQSIILGIISAFSVFGINSFLSYLNLYIRIIPYVPYLNLIFTFFIGIVLLIFLSLLVKNKSYIISSWITFVLLSVISLFNLILIMVRL